MNIIPFEIQSAIEHLRKEAQQKNDAADQLEMLYAGTPFLLSPTASVARTGAGGGGTVAETKSVSLEDLKAYLRVHGGRPNHLAKHFGVTEETINAIIAASKGQLVVIQRGWVKIASDLV